MGKMKKHTFEAVSLLALKKGLIDITIIPVQGQLDWLVPTNLILDNIELDQRIWTYQWQDFDVAIYHLVEKGNQPTKLIILEGSNDVYRVGLQINGELAHRQVSISDVKDIEGSLKFKQDGATSTDDDTDYIFQKVQIEGVEYIVPDLDELAHRLVDLDG